MNSSAPSPHSSPSPTASSPIPIRSRATSIPEPPPVRPHIRSTLTAPVTYNGRRPSIQFLTSAPDSGLPTGSPKPLPPYTRRRMSSPPPPETFQDRVSFDTFDNKDASDFSLTLNSKHKDYQYSRRSRTFLCGTDQNDYSEFALEWLIDELVDDGDEIVCLRVVDKDAKISSEASMEEGRYRTEAKKLLDQIIAKNTDGKAISLVLEFAVGKVHDTIQQMIRIYEPAILIVGTRGRSLGGFQGLLPGSVSKYCLQYSPVPVIVVRPTSKREKKKRKRQADPSRKDYLDMVAKTQAETGHRLDLSSRSSLAEGMLAAPEPEAEAAAAVMGLPMAHRTSTDLPGQTRRDSVTSELTSPGAFSTAGEAQSPNPSKLESPAESDSGASDDDDGVDAPGEEGPFATGRNFVVSSDGEAPATNDSEGERDAIGPGG